MRLFTDLGLDEITRHEALEGNEINEAKKILADQATRLCHGEDAARAAAETARRTFEDGAAGDQLPTVDLPRAELQSGIPAFEMLRRAGLAASNGEARRLIKGGGGRANDIVITDEMQTMGLADVNDQGYIKLSAGKKRHALVRAV